MVTASAGVWLGWPGGEGQAKAARTRKGGQSWHAKDTARAVKGPQACLMFIQSQLRYPSIQTTNEKRKKIVRKCNINA